MHNIVIDRPYRFVPPYRGTLWVRLLGWLLPRQLRRLWGVESHEFRGLDHLRQSLDAGHGILLAPNHCRPSDAMVMGILSRAVRRPFYAMASAHVFTANGRFYGWLANRLGAFSVNRWGLDREALKAATTILAHAERPLVLFPEGHITRTNDHLYGLLGGTSFIARSAAREREKRGDRGKVVVHPVALKYVFRGDVERSIGPVLDAIEMRCTWQKQTSMPIYERVVKLGKAMLSLKEIEYLGEPQPGTIPARLERLIDHLLTPLEAEWSGGRRQPSVAERAKVLRMAIVPDLADGDLAPAERERRLRQLADIYLAQQLALYPADYIASDPTPERILETVERFEEDLTDSARVHRPMHVLVQVGPPLEASADRPRGADDPLLGQLEQHLRLMLGGLAAEVRAERAAHVSAAIRPFGSR